MLAHLLDIKPMPMEPYDSFVVRRPLQQDLVWRLIPHLIFTVLLTRRVTFGPYVDSSRPGEEHAGDVSFSPTSCFPSPDRRFRLRGADGRVVTDHGGHVGCAAGHDHSMALSD